MHFFDAVDDKEMLDASPDAKANVGAVVQRIRQMAPKVDFVKLSGFHGLQHRSTNHADELTAQLVQLGHRIELESGITGIHYYLKVDDFRDLTYLDCHSGLDGEQITQLVRQNAPTLQYLSILLKDGFDYSVIIKDDDGSYLEYPRLRTLVVKVDHNLRARPKRDFAGAAPFPILWRLVCSAVCPFGDDMILFRGNAASLEYLKLILTRELATTLIRHDVFTPTSYSKLHHVSLRLDINMALDNPADYPEIMQLIEGVAPDAAVREILSLPFGLLSTPVLPLFGKFANIQVLVLPGLRLSVWDAMTLFNSLPLLSDFHALSPTLDPLPEGVTKRKLVAHVLSSYSPMALRFRCWHLGTRQDELLKVSATPFVLLALACPNFDFVAVDPKRRDMLTRALEKTIGVATYKRYVPRLRRLLPHGLE
ncbi:hypothetical protein H4218_003551 [Coemansia sp. IMI 209128]|nr:hypothetical protein H4218_003551 [Coemansia sp. IMI 209128]